MRIKYVLKTVQRRKNTKALSTSWRMDEFRELPPAHQACISIIFTFEPTARAIAVLMGATAAITLTAAAQLWDYPFPRGHLLLASFDAMLIAVPFGALAASLQFGQYRNSRRVFFLDVLMTLSILASIIFMIFGPGERLVKSLRSVISCADVANSEKCNARVANPPAGGAAI